MSKLKLKVCGMRDSENINGLVRLHPDFIGFNFYKKSPRYIGILEYDVMEAIPSSIKKVGVFVNASSVQILEAIEDYGLDLVQLHGDESLEQVEELHLWGVDVIKVFRISDELPTNLQEFYPFTEYFLFDTRDSGYGGTGKKFDWNLLKQIEYPFLLSGGIGPEDIQMIKEMDLPLLEGIDVNSKFEIEPGLKDLKKIEKLKEQL